MQCDFTIAFICGGGYEYFQHTLEENICSFCHNTIEDYDTLLFLDNADCYDIEPYLKLASKFQIDEIRLRSRAHNCASGDRSNNSHFHIFSDKTDFLITIESDVVVFKIDDTFDILNKIRQVFDRNKSLALATRVDDFDCWQERLLFEANQFTDDLATVNRVSSHFLVYQTHRCKKVFEKNDCLRMESFFDYNDRWYNYEDMLSRNFRYPSGPGIGYLNSFPIRVYHCDEKISEGSAFYKRDVPTRMRVFNTRKEEVQLLGKL